VGLAGNEAPARGRQGDAEAEIGAKEPEGPKVIGTPLLAAWIAQIAFWVLVVLGIFYGSLSKKGAAAFVACWVVGYITLPRIAWWTGAFLTSWVAVLDIVLVFIVFKGDVRVT
jgi:hypothetical protein